MSKKLLALALLATPLALTACPEKDEETDDSAVEDDSAAPEYTEECTKADIYESMLMTYSATYTVDSTADDHHKVHFDMPEGASHIIATTTWDCPDWTFNVDVGEGSCPHSGTTYVEEWVDGGEYVMDVYPEDVEAGLETFEGGTIWFVHMGVDQDPMPEDGSQCAITIKAETCVRTLVE